MMTFLTAVMLLASAAPQSNDPCRVTGAVNAADVERAQAACSTARERFRELFGAEAPAVETVLRNQRGYRVTDVGQGARVYWPTSAALGVPSVQAAAQWRDVLPHETMHALLAAHFFAAGDDLSAAYGTPLPDWFEEAVAIWAEPLASRRIRVAQARNLPAEFRDLEAILAGAHPAARNPALLAARDGAVLPRDDRALWAFYPQSIAVLSFIHDAGGAAAVTAFAQRSLDGGGDRASLAGLPGLPPDAEGVLAAWREWLPASGHSRALADQD